MPQALGFLYPHLVFWLQEALVVVGWWQQLRQGVTEDH
jgi:hypothetical protein